MTQRSMILDAIKGFLVLAMVTYHAFYIAVMFSFSNIELYTGFWWIFPRVIAAGFVLVSGWNLAAKRARGATLNVFAKRAGMLALIALGISAATGPVLDKGFVFFGVIHLLALSSLVAYPLLGRPILALLTGVAFLALGIALGRLRFDFVWLAWLGLRPANLHPADYLPLAPWLAFIAFGAAFRDLVFRYFLQETTRKKAKLVRKKKLLLDIPPPLIFRILAAGGRHSLKIYLAHLPLLYCLFSILNQIFHQR